MTFDTTPFQVIQKNPLLATGLGVWSAAMLSYFTRDLPKSVWRIIKNQFTVSIEIPSHEDAFKAVTQWLEDKGKTKSFRTLRLRGDKISTGLGTQYFFYQYRLWWVYRQRLDKSMGLDIRSEELTLGCFTRSQGIVRSLIDAAKINFKDNGKIRIYFNDEKTWSCCAVQDKKELDTVFLPAKIKSEAVKHLSTFFDSQLWYKKGGIPFRTGMCFYGPPGTGKTSFVKALASFYNLDIYVLDLSSQSDDSTRNLFAELPEKCLILIEDIDTIISTQKRTQSEKASATLTLGGMLNAIDGVVESNGRVLMMTTNHIQHLDPALVRPGRCDKLIEFSYLADETFRLAFNQFFPHFTLPCEVSWAKLITPAMLQTYVLENKENPSHLLGLLIEKENVMSPDFDNIYQLSLSSNVLG